MASNNLISSESVTYFRKNIQSKQRTAVETQILKCRKETKFLAKTFLKGIARKVKAKSKQCIVKETKEREYSKNGNPSPQEIKYFD